MFGLQKDTNRTSPHLPTKRKKPNTTQKQQTSEQNTIRYEHRLVRIRPRFRALFFVNWKPRSAFKKQTRAARLLLKSGNTVVRELRDANTNVRWWSPHTQRISVEGISLLSPPKQKQHPVNKATHSRGLQQWTSKISNIILKTELLWNYENLLIFYTELTKIKRCYSNIHLLNVYRAV